MPSFDSYAILSAALIAAVQQATAPLVERIAELESQVNGPKFATAIEEEVLANFEMADVVGAAQLDALEGVARALAQHNQSLITALEERIAALENNPAQGVDTSVVAGNYTPISNEQVKALLQEWATTGGFTIPIDEAKMVEALNSQEWFWDKLRNFIDAGIEQAVEQHCEEYDHDDYSRHIDDDDKHFEGDIEDAVRDALSNMTFDVSIR